MNGCMYDNTNMEMSVILILILQRERRAGLLPGLGL